MAHPEPIQQLLGLTSPPVALSFREEPPPGVSRIPGTAPAGCSYWKLAAEGGVFYTEAADHFGCPVGAHTHHVELPEEKARELEGLIGVMTDLEYIRLEEVAALPRRAEPLRVAVYAPLSEAPCEPDVVLVRGAARQIMLLSEAAQLAGAAGETPALGRPACVVVPQALNSGRTAVSLGCVGNRVYTGLADDELYFAIPGPQLAAVTEKLAVIARANEALEQFHRARAGAQG
jgi:uncharacterized protein (DUF169 family)